jgi:hypothetical protein
MRNLICPRPQSLHLRRRPIRHGICAGSRAAAPPRLHKLWCHLRPRNPATHRSSAALSESFSGRRMLCRLRPRSLRRPARFQACQTAGSLPMSYLLHLRRPREEALDCPALRLEQLPRAEISSRHRRLFPHQVPAVRPEIGREALTAWGAGWPATWFPRLPLSAQVRDFRVPAEKALGSGAPAMLAQLSLLRRARVETVTIPVFLSRLSPAPA